MKLNKYLLALTCSIATITHAESNGPYVAISVGQSSFDVSKGDTDAIFQDEGLTVNSSSLDDTDIAVKLQAGYQFSPYFAVEGGYINLGSTSYSATLNNTARASADVDASGLSISAIGVLPLGSDFSLFAKLGAINARVKTTVKASVNSTSLSGSEDSTDIKPIIGLGAAYALNPNVSFRAEIERYKDLGDDDTTGEGSVDLFSAGIVLKF